MEHTAAQADTTQILAGIIIIFFALIIFWYFLARWRKTSPGSMQKNAVPSSQSSLPRQLIPHPGKSRKTVQLEEQHIHKLKHVLWKMLFPGKRPLPPETFTRLQKIVKKYERSIHRLSRKEKDAFARLQQLVTTMKTAPHHQTLQTEAEKVFQELRQLAHRKKP